MEGRKIRRKNAPDLKVFAPDLKVSGEDRFLPTQIWKDQSLSCDPQFHSWGYWTLWTLQSVAGSCIQPLLRQKRFKKLACTNAFIKSTLKSDSNKTGWFLWWWTGWTLTATGTVKWTFADLMKFAKGFYRYPLGLIKFINQFQGLLPAAPALGLLLVRLLHC